MDDLEFNDVFGIGCEIESEEAKCEIDDIKGGHREFFPVSRLLFNVLGAKCSVRKTSNREYEISCEQKTEV